MNLAEVRLISSIHCLLGHDESLVYFFFHHKERKLRLPVDELLAEARALSSGEYLLIQAAIDFWNGEGGLRINRALDVWEDENILSFVRGLLRLRQIDFSEIERDGGGC